MGTSEGAGVTRSAVDRSERIKGYRPPIAPPVPECLGAKPDGVLRAHKLLPDGSWRDTVVFSILHSEWAAVRAGLEARIR